MKALSLIQPYATLIMLGYKRNETRSWRTTHRGPLAIHASVGKPKWAREVTENDPHIKAALAKHGLSFDTLPRGAVLGVCQLLKISHIIDNDVVDGKHLKAGQLNPDDLDDMELAAGDYTPGRYAWHLADVSAAANPIACKGALSLWQVPASVHQELLTALGV